MVNNYLWTTYPVRARMGAGAYPTWHWAEAGYTVDRSPDSAFTLLFVNLLTDRRNQYWYLLPVSEKGSLFKMLWSTLKHELIYTRALKSELSVLCFILFAKIQQTPLLTKYGHCRQGLVTCEDHWHSMTSALWSSYPSIDFCFLLS